MERLIGFVCPKCLEITPQLEKWMITEKKQEYYIIDGQLNSSEVITTKDNASFLLMRGCYHQIHGLSPEDLEVWVDDERKKVYCKYFTYPVVDEGIIEKFLKKHLLTDYRIYREEE